MAQDYSNKIVQATKVFSVYRQEILKEKTEKVEQIISKSK
jgi:hypothetical protein